jgi:hypothetical protein
MSVITCIKCSARVDTDFDHECKEGTCEPCQREMLEANFVKAALALAEHAGAYAFSVPIKNTSPALYVELTEQSGFAIRRQLADATRKLEEARKDGERYRYLRGYNVNYSFLWESGACMEAMDELVDIYRGEDGHDSDCATHNEPAYPNGDCNCSKSAIDQAIEHGKGGDDA